MITIEKNSLKVGKYVNTEYVNEVIRTYKQERWVHNSERIGKEDSLSVWFPVEDLEKFIQDAKTNGADGIKFYFAAYPENFEEKPEYAGRQTIVLVATKSKKTESGNANKDLYITRNGNSTIMGINLGLLCPPYCSGFAPAASAEVGITLVDRGEKGVSVV
ncbi:MAG TPA: hypothetical protein VMH01_13430 [Puia sp.]|nr:hypothetical protein [Puia sp.]